MELALGEERLGHILEEEIPIAEKLRAHIKKLIKVKTYCFDLDGVICNNTYGKYSEAKPYKKAIKINLLYDQGNIIIIFTSRYMGKFKNNRIKAINFGLKKLKINLSHGI